MYVHNKKSTNFHQWYVSQTDGRSENPVWVTTARATPKWEKRYQMLWSAVFEMKSEGLGVVLSVCVWQQVLFSCGSLSAQLSHCGWLLMATDSLQAASQPCCQHARCY